MKKKKNTFPKKTALLLGAAALLLLGSTVGSTRAALTYYSENYVAGVEMSSIGITLLENDQTISKRNYDKNGEWMVEKEERELLQDLLGENEDRSGQALRREADRSEQWKYRQPGTRDCHKELDR